MAGWGCRIRRAALGALGPFGAGAAAFAWALAGGPGAAAQPVTLFAAASTTDAVEAVVEAYAAAGGGPVRTVFAASSTLARQIAQGAPADLYLSAHVAWMDHLAGAGALEPGSRVDLLGNRLVLIAPAEHPLDLAIAPGFALAAALGGRRLALGDPGHVPAGQYAEAALERLGVWDQVAPKALYLGDVRAALALVERGEAAAGIVYATDARISDRVRVVGEFPSDSHEPIVYPLALVAGRRSPAAEAFYRFLQGPSARAVFRAHGFLVPAAGG